MRYITYIVALFHIFHFYWKDRSEAGRCLNQGLIRSLCFRKNDPNKKSQMLLKKFKASLCHYINCHIEMAVAVSLIVIKLHFAF